MCVCVCVCNFLRLNEMNQTKIDFPYVVISDRWR